MTECKHEPAPRTVPAIGCPLPTCIKCGIAYMVDVEDDDDSPKPTTETEGDKLARDLADDHYNDLRDNEEDACQRDSHPHPCQRTRVNARASQSGNSP